MKNIKKAITAAAALAAVMTVMSFTACGDSSSPDSKTKSENKETTTTTTTSAEENTAETDSANEAAENTKDVTADFPTLGDAFKYTDNAMSSWNEKLYVYCFSKEGTPYRVTAEMTKELSDKANDFDNVTEEDRIDLLSGQKVIKAEDLSAEILTEEQLDKYVGQKGQVMIDDGFEVEGSWSFDEELTITLINGDISYDVTFKDAEQPGDDFDEEKACKELTVSSVTYAGLSYKCTDLLDAQDEQGM